MNAQMALWGRLGAQPRQLDTQSGTLMAIGSVAVDVGDAEAPEWFGIVAFGRQAEDLLRHGKGEAVSVSGRVQRRTWNSGEEERTQLQVVADSLVSSRSVRPGGRRTGAQKDESQEQEG